MDIKQYSAIHSLGLDNFDLTQPIFREEQQILLQMESCKLLFHLILFNMLILAKLSKKRVLIVTYGLHIARVKYTTKEIAAVVEYWHLG